MGPSGLYCLRVKNVDFFPPFYIFRQLFKKKEEEQNVWQKPGLVNYYLIFMKSPLLFSPAAASFLFPPSVLVIL